MEDEAEIICSLTVKWILLFVFRFSFSIYVMFILVCVRVCVSGKRTDVTVRCQVNQDTAAVLRTTCSEMSGQDRAAFGTHMSALLCTHL